MKDRLALIKRLAAPRAPLVTAKPAGMHVAQNPDEKVTNPKKLYRSDRYGPRKPGAMAGPSKLGIYGTMKVKNHSIFHGTWKKARKRKLGERRGKKVSALTKIAHAKPAKLERVPPWQQKRSR